MNIYEINQNYAAIIAALEESEGELTPEIEDALAINDESFDEKAEYYIKAIFNFRAEMDACKAEAKRLNEKAKHAENVADRLQDTISSALKLRGIEKKQFGNFTASFRKSEKVIVDDGLVETLPDNYKRVKTTVEADKTALKAAIKAGESIYGVTLQTNYTLNIK